MGFGFARKLSGAALMAAMASALAGGLFATPALADDPRDPAMTPEAIARDREIIRRMNLDQMAKVRQRDAGYAEGWRAYDAAQGRSRSARRDDRHENEGYQGRSSYADAQAQYRDDLARWRRDVEACRAGYTEYCARR